MNEKQSKNGIGFLSILTIIFVIAKLFGVITWSWLIVFLPTILSILIWLVLIIVAIVIVALDK